MNIRIIEEKYKDRFVFKNTYFCEKTLFPIFTFTDTYDETEYKVESSQSVQLEVVLKNIVVEKRNRKIEKILA